MGPTEPRGPPGQLGGCFGGVYSPGGPLRYGRSRFFGLLCLNNYFKTFQKSRMSKLSLRGTPMVVPPWGGGRSPKVHGPKVHKARARAFDYFECFRSLLAVLKFLEVLTMQLAVVGATIHLWQTYLVDGKNLQNYKKAPARAFAFHQCYLSLTAFLKF